MSSLRKFFDHLEERRTDVVKRVFRENYSILLTLGSLDLNFTEKWAPWTILLVLYNYVILANQDWMLFYSCFLLIKDFDSASGDGNYGLLVLLAIVFMISFHYRRDLMIEVHQEIGDGIFHYSEEPIETSDMQKFRKDLKFQYTLLIILAVYVCFIGVLAVAGPVLDNKLGFGYPGTYDENGVNRQLPVPLFLPFETEEWFGWFVAVGMTTLSGCATCAVIGGASLIFTTLAQFILTEQKKLYCSVKAVPYRAKRMYCKKFNIANGSISTKNIFSNQDFQDCITSCLRENIMHHHKIIEFAKKGETLTEISTFSGIMICNVAIGLTLIKLNQDMHKVGSSIAFLSVAIGELFNMLNLAVYGEYMMSLSQELNWEIYFLPWYKFNLANKKLVRRFLLGTQKTLCLHAWIVRLDMEMFSSVINTAYSFFNFLKLGDLRSE